MSLMWFDIQAIQAAYGIDTVTTAGADTYTIDLAGRHYETIWDYGGTDRLVLKGSKDVIIDLTPGTWQDVGTVITFSASADGSFVGRNEATVFIAPDTIIENLTSGDGDDAITGNAADNRLQGGGGRDSIAGGWGNDTITGGTDIDQLQGGLGDDVLFAGVGDISGDFMNGGTGADIIGGGAGNDFLIGDEEDMAAIQVEDAPPAAHLVAGADTIFGGDGDDIILTGTHNDTNVDGAYNSLEEGTAGTDSNVVWAGAGDDTVMGTNGAETLGGGDGDDIIAGFGGADLIYAGAGDDSSGGVNDRVDAGNGADTVFGGGGDDRLGGGDWTDLLFNGAGEDTVDGGWGNDTLWAGPGDDTLTGSQGSDTFGFTLSGGHDRVTDFSVGEDILDLTQTDISSLEELASAASEEALGSSTGVLLVFSQTSSLFLVGLTLADLEALTTLYAP